MVFGHPILPWHKCGPRPSGTLPMGMVMGLFWHFELFFGQKWSLWTQNWKISEKKMGKKAKKSHQRLLMATMVALAAGRGAKMALRLNTVSKFWSLLLDISGLFHLHTKYKQWTSLFSIKIGSAKSLLGPYKILIRKCKQIGAQPGIAASPLQDKIIFVLTTRLGLSRFLVWWAYLWCFSFKHCHWF